MMRHLLLLSTIACMASIAPAAPDSSGVIAELQRLQHTYGGHLGVMAKNLRTGETLRYNAEERFPTASLIKYPVMAAYFKAVAEGA